MKTIKKNSRKSLLNESIYQIFIISLGFIFLTGMVVLYDGLLRYQDKQKYYIQAEYERLENIEHSKEVKDEIKNIYNYLSYEYNYAFEHSSDLLNEQVNIIQHIIKDSNVPQETLDKMLEHFLLNYSYPIVYSIVKSDDLYQDTKTTKYIKMQNDEYLKIALDTDKSNSIKLDYILSNIEKFRISRQGYFTSKFIDKNSKKVQGCEYKNDGKIASYRCYDELWGIEFGSIYDVDTMYQNLKIKENQVKKEIIQQILIVTMLVVLGVIAIIVFIKNKQRIIKENIANINQSLDSLDGDLTKLKLNLNPNIKYAEFKFLNLALNKFIMRMKKTQELIADKNKEILQKAYYDGLTGLKNTTKLLIDLKKYHYSDNQTKLVVFFIDLDKFKQINESKGRDVGDKILQEMAKRLNSLIDQQKDHLSRVAADEFVIAKEFEVLATHSDMEFFAHSIIKEINKPIKIDEELFYFTAAIGVEVNKEEYEGNYEELIGSADSAMGIAKKKGSNKIEFYDKIIDEKRKESLKIQKNLRMALKENEFKLFFQPKVNVKTGEVVGAEALIRWIKNDKIIPPGYFIEVAENSNLIVDIGRWVINESFKILKSWVDNGKKLKISINLSVKQLKSETIIEDIKNAFERYKVPPELIEFEITENFAIKNTEHIDKINTIKSLGVGLSIDDFGKGYSSLSYLHDLPFDVVKIDMSFVLNMHKDPRKQALVDAIVQLSKTLDKRTVAEGVEFKDDIDLLKKFGCDEFQGYYFSKPLPEYEFYDLLTNEEKNKAIDVSVPKKNGFDDSDK